MKKELSSLRLGAQAWVAGDSDGDGGSEEHVVIGDVELEFDCRDPEALFARIDRHVGGTGGAGAARAVGGSSGARFTEMDDDTGCDEGSCDDAAACAVACDDERHRRAQAMASALATAERSLRAAASSYKRHQKKWVLCAE